MPLKQYLFNPTPVKTNSAVYNQTIISFYTITQFSLFHCHFHVASPSYPPNYPHNLIFSLPFFLTSPPHHLRRRSPPMALIPISCSPNLRLSPFQPPSRSLACLSKLTVQRGGAASSFACSTSHFRGRIGFHFLRRQPGKLSSLSFGADNRNAVGEVRERDLSQLLSALLPVVVAATAVAALVQPSTFTW